MAYTRDLLVDLVAGAPPSPKLGPCAILIWISSAFTRYSVVAETAGRHLFDGQSVQIHRTVRQRVEALGLLATLHRYWTCLPIVFIALASVEVRLVGD